MSASSIPSPGGSGFVSDGALHRGVDFESPYLTAATLEIDKRLQKDDMVDLVDEPRLTIVERLHLIAKIKIEVLRNFVVHAEKKSVLIKS